MSAKPVCRDARMDSTKDLPSERAGHTSSFVHRHELRS